ncbi:MAG: hypothetical protein OEV00_16530, partial [Acidobacteriota bacterium]|nr:hypothetical protein [Acidobacteriota bacterium]
MQEPQLTLIDERSEAGRPDGRGPLWIALTLLATAALATIFGADIARQTVDTREQAEKIGRLSLTEGSRSPATQAALREFRETLVERPLDSRRRAQYGALLLDLGRDATDARAAAFHARQAVALAPVTVPTLRIAARTLVRTGDRDTSVTLVRRMFQFDAPAAARLLLEIEPWLYAGELDDALPDDPEAWLAWYGRLRREGRSKSSLPVMAQLRRRWPDFLAARVAEALQVNRAGDDLTLRRLLPADERLPETRAAAPLHALRGRI